MPDTPRDRPHFHISGGGESEIYMSPRRPLSGFPPARLRAEHAARLERALGTAIAQSRERLAARDPEIAEGQRGFYLDFDVPLDQQVALDSLENRRKAIELV